MVPSNTQLHAERVAARTDIQVHEAVVLTALAVVLLLVGAVAQLPAAFIAGGVAGVAAAAYAISYQVRDALGARG